MKFKKFIKIHHNLIISIIDMIQIVNIFVKSTIIAIIVVVMDNIMSRDE